MAGLRSPSEFNGSVETRTLIFLISVQHCDHYTKLAQFKSFCVGVLIDKTFSASLLLKHTGLYFVLITTTVHLTAAISDYLQRFNENTLPNSPDAT